MQRHSISLHNLSRLSAQLNEDASVSLKQLQQRDHAIGARLRANSDIERILAWLDDVSPLNSNQERNRASTETAIGFWILCIGFVCGIIAMVGLLLADVQKVINVLLFLALFIGTQLLMLLLTLIVSFSAARGVSFYLPFEHLNPARLLFRRAIQQLAGHIPWDNYKDLSRMALLRWGQLFGASFNIAALLTFVIILTATDRSFGWSSTFNISDEGIYRLTRILAYPWHWLVEEAGVSLQVVSGSRFQSLQRDFDSQQIATMRSWWPFLFACIVFYGLLPRLLLFPIFHFGYRRRLRRAFLCFPGVNLLLDRLKSPHVETQAGNPPQKSQWQPKNQIAHSLPHRATVLNWTGAANANRQQIEALGFNDQSLSDAGLDLDQDRQLLATLSQQNPSSIIIVVKSWEPPLAELEDFIQQLNSNNECYLLLLPMQNQCIAKDELQDWQQFAGRCGVKILLGDNSEGSDE